MVGNYWEILHKFCEKSNKAHKIEVNVAIVTQFKSSVQ